MLFPVCSFRLLQHGTYSKRVNCLIRWNFKIWCDIKHFVTRVCPLWNRSFNPIMFSLFLVISKLWFSVVFDVFCSTLWGQTHHTLVYCRLEFSAQLMKNVRVVLVQLNLEVKLLEMFFCPAQWMAAIERNDNRHRHRPDSVSQLFLLAREYSQNANPLNSSFISDSSPPSVFRYSYKRACTVTLFSTSLSHISHWTVVENARI